MHKLIFSVFMIIVTYSLGAQVNVVEGYVYEDGNRGFLNQVKVEIVDKSSGISVYTGETNPQGYFEAEVPAGKDYKVNAVKQVFKKKSVEFSADAADGEKKFVKIKMLREPGYDFEVTLAPKRESEDIAVDAIRGAWIEVYNNTTKEEVLNLKDHDDMEFNAHFDQGNHYTIMVRKDGFLTKRMEAYVNIEGCILCFDGVGSVQPGVTDNLSDKNSMGVLLANVEMEPLFNGKTFTVENIYYDLGKSTLRPEAKESLKNLAVVISDNPQIKIELGAHTDSRGESLDNLELSKKRAKAAVSYLVDKLDVSPSQIISQGYGESYLKNECSDGVKCSDEEHQKNRRTEVRILNIDKSKTNLKSLAEIRVEEEFMKSLFDGEVVTKTEGSATMLGGSETVSEEEMKKIIEMEQAEREDAKVVLETIEEESKVDLQKEKESKALEMETAAKEKAEFERIEQEKKEREMKAEAAKEAEMKLAAEKKKAAEMELAERKAAEAKMMAQVIEAEKKRAAEIAKQKETAKAKEIPVYNGTRSTLEKKAVITTEEAEPEFGNRVSQQQRYEQIQKAKDPMFNYTGYKIVVQFSSEPISQDSDVYKRHDDLAVYKSQWGSYLYMIGDFPSEAKADEFLVKTAGQIYPGAYIVGFKNGKRLN